jgi:hypothetical protein
MHLTRGRIRHQQIVDLVWDAELSMNNISVGVIFRWLPDNSISKEK